MESSFRNRGIAISVSILLALGLVSCQEFILGTIERGDPVAVEFYIASLNHDTYSPGTLSITNYLTIDKVQLEVWDIDLRDQLNAGYKFNLPDSELVFTEEERILKISEKVVPEGVYNQFLVGLGGEPERSSISRQHETPIFEKPGSGGLKLPQHEAEGRRISSLESEQGFRYPGNHSSGSGYGENIGEKAETGVVNRQLMDIQSGPLYSLKIQGRFRGKNFEFVVDESIERLFQFEPQMSIGNDSDTVTTVRLIFDYSRWFEGQNHNEYLDPTNMANRAMIHQNIIGSINLDYYKGNDAPEIEGVSDGSGGELPVLQINSEEVSEKDGRVELSVRIPQAINYTVQVDYETRDASAEAGSDYTASSGTLTIEPGEVQSLLEIPVVDDGADEGGRESFNVLFSNPVNAILETHEISCVIIDNKGTGNRNGNNNSGNNGNNGNNGNKGNKGNNNSGQNSDDLPKVGIADASAPESAGNMIFEVTLSAASEQPVSVEYATKAGSAKAGQDYTAAAGTLTFNPGQTQKTLQVGLVDDAAEEPDEQFMVRLSGPVNAELDPPSKQARGTILDDDEPAAVPDPEPAVLPKVGIADASAPESAGNMIFEVTLSAASEQPVSVEYATKAGSAKAGQDYTAAAGTLTFNPGQTQKTLQVGLVDDAAEEPDEQFMVRLSGPVNAELDPLSEEATGTIQDDDEAEVDDDPDKVTICHYPPGKSSKARTLTINTSAWPAHEAHGDTIGPCSES